MFKVFIEFPAVNTGVVDVLGWSPLHHACANGHIECARILLQKKADPHLKDLRGETPKRLALKLHNEELINVLNRFGSHLALIDAAKKASEIEIRRLLE